MSTVPGAGSCELHRQGHEVARCTVERLMRELGRTGAVRGKRIITTIPGDTAERAPDLVNRNFVASAPNGCWVADFTHVKTWSAVVYVAFVVDAFSRWNEAGPLPYGRVTVGSTTGAGRRGA